jgi:CheY-like chemotaxis protein
MDVGSNEVQKMTKRILIVEPDPETARNLFLLFHAEPGHTAEEDFAVELADCLPEAIEKAQTIQFHCIIMDVNIAEPTDIDAMRLLRTTDNNTPIIATTKINNLALETKVREHGAFYYYITSFDPSDLKLAVTCALHKTSHRPLHEHIAAEIPGTLVLKPLQSLLETHRDTGYDGNQ